MTNTFPISNTTISLDFGNILLNSGGWHIDNITDPNLFALVVTETGIYKISYNINVGFKDVSDPSFRAFAVTRLSKTDLLLPNIPGSFIQLDLEGNGLTKEDGTRLYK